jgi:hypothetical protein
MFLAVDIFCSAYIFFALSFENESVVIVLLIVWIVNVHAVHFTISPVLIKLMIHFYWDIMIHCGK